ncbi:hypothetical protein [Saliphagus infecundisoli]|nr:hypothetical protein [Saliphagus infecundisoli]
MAPGRTPRNLVVLVVYLICFPVVPFVLAYAAFSNYNQISDRLAMRNTPGFTPGGGVKPAAVTLVVLLVTISLIASLGVAPFLVLADSGGGSQASTDNEPGSGADDLGADEEGGEGDDEEREEEAGEGEEQGGNTADSDDGFGGESFIDGGGESFIDGGASASDDLSDEERAANTQGLFEDMLTEAGYEITDGEMDEGVIHIEYRTYAEDRDEALAEIVEIAANYAGMEGVLRNEVAEEEEYEGVFKEQTEGLHVTILDPNDVVQGTFSVESEWAMAFFNEEISEEEYLDRVEETIEIPDHFENSDEFGDSESDDNSSG